MEKSLLGFVLAMVAVAGAAFAGCPNHAIWDGLLKANVDNGGFVDYDSIRINKGGDLYEYLSFLETADLGKCTESGKLAFWINAYNAHMVKQVLAHPQMKKVSEDFDLFDKKTKVARENVSLNEIEHRIIRSDPAKGGPIEGASLKESDPRVHFALVCGAVDCPKLLNRAYKGETLENALQTSAIYFANSPKHLRLEGDELVVSTLMKWYADDFEKAGGAAEYLISLTDPKLRPDESAIDAKLKEDFPSNVRFEYDWTLNDVSNKPK